MKTNYKYAGMAASGMIIAACAVSLPMYYPFWEPHEVAYLNYGLLILSTLYLGIHVGLEWRSYQLKKMFSAGFGSGEQIQEEPTPELPDPCKVMPAPEYDPARSFFPNSSRPDFRKPAPRPKSKKNKKR